MFRTILVPIDLAEPEIAQKAIKTAVSLAEGSGGALRLINVQQLLPATYMDYAPADFDIKQREWADNEMKAMCGKIDLPEARVSSKVRMGGIIRKFWPKPTTGALTSSSSVRTVRLCRLIYWAQTPKLLYATPNVRCWWCAIEANQVSGNASVRLRI